MTLCVVYVSFTYVMGEHQLEVFNKYKAASCSVLGLNSAVSLALLQPHAAVVLEVCLATDEVKRAAYSCSC
jgi:hypothetical protein